MGETAENVAERYGVTREQQDEYAVRSQDLRGRGPGVAASSTRRSSRSSCPTARSSTKDDGPRPGTTVEKLAGLKPVFREGGTVTAGNACPLNDGAAAVLLMSADRAKELGLKPRARVIASATQRQRAGVHGRRADRRDPERAQAHRHVDRATSTWSS